jgi:hypothetical protein
MCVRGISFASVSVIFQSDLELFGQCDIFIIKFDILYFYHFILWIFLILFELRQRLKRHTIYFCHEIIRNSTSRKFFIHPEPFYW